MAENGIRIPISIEATGTGVQTVKDAYRYLNDAAKASDKFGKEMAKALKSADTSGVSASFADTARKLSELIRSVADYSRTIKNDMSPSFRQLVNYTKDTAQAMRQLQTNLRETGTVGSASVDQLNRALTQLMSKAVATKQGSWLIKQEDIRSLRTYTQELERMGQSLKRVAETAARTNVKPVSNRPGWSNEWGFGSSPPPYVQSGRAPSYTQYGGTVARPGGQVYPGANFGFNDPVYGVTGAPARYNSGFKYGIASSMQNVSQFNSHSRLGMMTREDYSTATNQLTVARNVLLRGADAEESKRVMTAYNREIKNLKDQFEGTSRSGKTLVSMLKDVTVYSGMYRLLAFATELPANFVKVAAAMEQMKAQYKGVFGDRGGAEFEYVASAANKYGKSIEDVSAAYLKFSASAEYMGVASDQTKRIFEAVSQAISKVGGSSQDVSGTLLAMQQMLSKGTVMSEEFRLQFAERIPGAMKMGADALGVTVEQFKKMMEQGQVISSEFIPKLTVQMEKFAKGWEQSTDTLTSNWTRLGNSIKVVISNLSDNSALNSAVKGLNAAAEWAGTQSAVHNTTTRVGRLQWLGFDMKAGEVNAENYKQYENLVSPYFNASPEEQYRMLSARRDLNREKLSKMSGWEWQKRASDEGQWDNRLTAEMNKLYPQVEIKQLQDSITDIVQSGKVNQFTEELGYMQELLFKMTGKVFTVQIDVPIDAVVSATRALQELYKTTSGGKLQEAYNRRSFLEKTIGDNEAIVENLDKEIRSGNMSGGELDAAINRRNQAFQNISVGKLLWGDTKGDIQSGHLQVVKDTGPAARALSEFDKMYSGGHLTKALKQRHAFLNYQAGLERAQALAANPGEFKNFNFKETVAGLSQQYDQALKDAEGKGGGAAANAASRFQAKEESSSFRRMKFMAGMYGDGLLGNLFGTRGEYVTKIEEMSRLGKKGNMGESAVLQEEMRLKMAKQVADAYDKQNDSLASQVASLASLTDSPALRKQADLMKAEADFGAIKQDNLAKSIQLEKEALADQEIGGSLDKESLSRWQEIIALKEKELAMYPALLEASRKKAEYEEKVANLAPQGELSKMTGDAQSYYAVQIQIKEAELGIAGNIHKRKLLLEEISRLQAKKDMNVGKLMQDGMADYAIRTYDELADKIGTAIPNSLDTLGSAISDNMVDLFSGAKTVSQAFEDMGKTMRNAILRTIIDIGVLIAKTQLLKALGLGAADSMSSMGIPGTSTAGTASGGGFGTGGTNILGQIGSLFSSSNSSGYVSGVLSPAYSHIAVGTPTNTSGWGGTMAVNSMEANLAAQNGGVATAGGGASALGAGMAAGGIGFAAGSVARPDSMLPAMVGAGAGLTAGLLGASPLLAGTALIGALGATGFGALVAIPAAIGMALAMGTTSKTEPTGKSGLIVHQQNPFKSFTQGFQQMRTTKSGAFGSSSTSHSIAPFSGDPELEKAWNEGMLANYVGVSKSALALGMGARNLKDFNLPMAFPLDSDHLKQFLYNMKSAMAEFTIRSEGMISVFTEISKNGESLADTLTRVSEAYVKGGNAAAMAGIDLYGLTGSYLKSRQGAAISDMAERVGGNDAFTSIMSALLKWNGKTPAAIKQASVSVGTNALQAISMIGDNSVGLDNFWERFRSAMNAGMSADDFELWANAATAMDSFQTSLEALTSTLSSKYLSDMTSAISSLGSSIKSLKDYRTSLYMSTLSDPQQVYNISKSKYQETLAKAMGGDTQAMADLQNDASSFLNASKSVNADYLTYLNDFANVQGDVSSVINFAENTLNSTKEQLDLMKENNQISQDIYDSLTKAIDEVFKPLNANILSIGLAAMSGTGTGSLTAEITGNYSGSYGSTAAKREQAQANIDSYNQEIQRVQMYMGMEQSGVFGGMYAGLIPQWQAEIEGYQAKIAALQAQLDSNSFASGGIMTRYGKLPVREYASGGIATSPQLALFGEGSMPEAYIPLPDGKLHTVLDFINVGNSTQVESLWEEVSNLRKDMVQFMMSMSSDLYQMRVTFDQFRNEGIGTYDAPAP